MRAHKAFQQQWAIWSESHAHLDGSIRMSMPKEEDMLEARMALQPMYALRRDEKDPTKQKGKPDKGKGKRQDKRWNNDQPTKGQRRGKDGLTSLQQSLRDRLAKELGIPRHLVLAATGGTQVDAGTATKGKGPKGKSKGKEKTKGQARTPQVCANWLEGNCRFGDRCRYLHES